MSRVLMRIFEVIANGDVFVGGRRRRLEIGGSLRRGGKFENVRDVVGRLENWRRLLKVGDKPREV
jgi:hypothetical protein